MPLLIGPLSAYNIYFRQERPALIARYEQGESQPDFDANMASAVEAGKEKAADAADAAADKAKDAIDAVKPE